MKQITILFLCLLLLCACVPTPETDAVRQKNTNVLIDTVRSADESPQPVRFEHFRYDATASRGNVHISADVPIEVLSETGTFPVVRVEHRFLSDAERLTLAKRLLGSDSLYLWEQHETRAMLEAQIREYLSEPTPEEKAAWLRETGGSEADWEQVQSNRAALANALMQRYNALPLDDDVQPLPAWDGAAPTYSEDYANHRNDCTVVGDAYATDAKERLNYVTVWSDEMDRPIEFQVAQNEFSDLTNVWFFTYDATRGAEHIAKTDYGRPHDGARITPNDAINTVQAVFDGICSFRAAEVFWTDNGTENEQNLTVVTRTAYLVVLTSDVGGANTVFSPTTVIDFNEETEVVRWWANEALLAAVDGDGRLLSLAWTAPPRVTETVTDQAVLLPVEQIQSILTEQLGRMFVIRSDVQITGVTLGLYRIREQNNLNAGLLVPAWFFTGELRAANAATNGYDTYIRDCMNPLLIVNAIDGSIIDPAKGY